MRSYGDNGEVREVLSSLETALETYLEAWRREFGMGERSGAVSGKIGLSPRGGPRCPGDAAHDAAPEVRWADRVT